MTKSFHINPETGAIGECRAEKACRFGGAHYPDYDTAADAAENLFAEQYGLFPGGGEKPEVDVLTEYRMDGEGYDNAMIHLGGIADALEWHDPNDPEWAELRAEIQYVPSMAGPLSDFKPSKSGFEGEMGDDWPSDFYAQTLVDGQASRKDLLKAARELSRTIDEYDEED